MAERCSQSLISQQALMSRSIKSIVEPNCASFCHSVDSVSDGPRAEDYCQNNQDILMTEMFKVNHVLSILNILRAKLKLGHISLNLTLYIIYTRYNIFIIYICFYKIFQMFVCGSVIFESHF